MLFQFDVFYSLFISFYQLWTVVHFIHFDNGCLLHEFFLDYVIHFYSN